MTALKDCEKNKKRADCQCLAVPPVAVVHLLIYLKFSSSEDDSLELLESFAFFPDPRFSLGGTDSAAGAFALSISISYAFIYGLSFAAFYRASDC